MVVTQPLYTSTSDVLGRSIPLYISFVLFIGGSIVFALAPNMAIVILGRVLQGLGAGGLDILGEIIVADMTNLKERPLYLGLLAIPMSGGSILGPFVGALLSEYLSWRWIGWINVPIGALGLLLVIFFLRLRPIEASYGSKLRRLDWAGMVIFTLGCTAFTLPLSWAGSMYPWASWQTLVTLIIGLILLVAFGFYESRPQEPVMAYRLFGSVTAMVTLAGTFIHGMIVYCLLQYLPIFFQAVTLESPLQSVVSLLPLSLSVIGFSCLSAIAVDYTRNYTWNIWLGWVLVSVGVGLMTLLGQHSPSSIRIGSQIIAGIGIGILNCILVIPMQASVLNVDDTGLAVGLQVSFRLFGASIGIAVGSSIFNSVYESDIAKLLPLPESLVALSSANQAIESIPALPTVDIQPEILDAILNVYKESIRAICYTLVALSGLATILSLLTKNISMEKEDMGRQRFEPST